MPATKVAITVDTEILKTVDRWVVQGRYPNRSRAIQAAIREKMDRWEAHPPPGGPGEDQPRRREGPGRRVAGGRHVDRIVEGLLDLVGAS